MSQFLNITLSNTSSSLVPPYNASATGIIADAVVAPTASLDVLDSLLKSAVVGNSAALVGRRMLQDLIGPAGLSPSYALTAADMQEADASLHMSDTTSLNGTSSWEPPHLSRVLQQADKLNFQPLAATVAAYEEVVNVIGFISTNILDPLDKVRCELASMTNLETSVDSYMVCNASLYCVFCGPFV